MPPKTGGIGVVRRGLGHEYELRSDGEYVKRLDMLLRRRLLRRDPLRQSSGGASELRMNTTTTNCERRT